MKEKIIQSAMVQIERFGLRRFIVDDIASDLGMSKKTIYKYFTSKKEIISSVVEFNLELEKERTLAAIETEGGWIDKLKAVMFCYTQDKIPAWLLEELQRFFPEEWEKTEAIRKIKRQILKELIAQGISRNDVKADIKPEIIEFVLDKTIGGLFDYGFMNKHNITINDAMEEIKKIVLFGILRESETVRGVKREV